MKLLKKNQVIIYVTALMLVVAGYLNYTTTNDMNSAVQTTASEEELVQMANIGDAQLVSSNVVSEENTNSIESNNFDTNDKNSKAELNEIKKEEVIETYSKNANNNSDYYSTSKLERDTMYSQMIETYEKILNSTNSMETQKTSASTEISKINNTKNAIMISENLIKTKGFEDVVIFVNNESVSVIVKDDDLTKEEVAQIQNIVSRELNVKAENLHISSKK